MNLYDLLKTVDWRVTRDYVTEKRSALKKASDASVVRSPEHAAILDQVNEIKLWLETNSRHRLSFDRVDEDGYILPSEVERVIRVLGTICYYEMILSDLVKDPKDEFLKDEISRGEEDLIVDGVTVMKET